MYKNNSIKSFSALLMLLLFAFSITPKRFLHNVFADHEDRVVKIVDSDVKQISKKEFNCDCNTLVATSPFTEHQLAGLEISSLQAYRKFHTTYRASFFLTAYSFTELRGPPAIA